MLKNQLNLIHIREVMDELEVSRSTIDRWRKNKQLPSVKIGKEIYFDRHEVTRWYKEFGQAPRTPLLPDTPTLTIGYTTVSTHMWGPLIIKEFGLLEEELRRIRPKDRIDIRWHRAKDGMELIKGMLAGQIQIATFGDYALSVSHMISELLPGFHPVLLAAAGKSSDGDGFGLVVPADLTLSSVSELATLPIATTFRTNADYRLKKLLESHSLPELNIIHRSIEESMESLRQGRLSASIMWEPFLSLVQHQKIGKSVFNRELGLGFIASVAADEHWVREHEDLTIAYLKAHLRAGKLIREQPARAAEVCSRETELPLDVTSRSISRIRWDAALYTRDLELLNGFDPAKSFSQAMLPHPEIPYTTKYLRIAAQELRLPVLPKAPIDGPWHRDIYY
ncbi:helix-turn-helix domain-containing protein [Paenibacillus filicis]|uniref:Helix-turn-helix domain-containing protein n=1 Tax=Paenibacillus filicis TaxID=669464 RepID=A0ABU9DWP1_9BACL